MSNIPKIHKKTKNFVSESTFFLFSFYFSTGLRITFAMMTPLALGVLFDQLNFGILASSGALIAGAGDNPGSFKVKLRTQSIGALFYLLLVVISQFLLPYREHVITFGLWVTFCGFFFSMFFIYGARAVSVSTASLFCIVYACSFYHKSIWFNTLGIMSGVLFYGIVSLGLWRIQPYRVIEQRLSEGIKLLSEYTELLLEYIKTKERENFKKNRLKELYSKILEKQEKVHANQEDIRENLFKLRINAKSFSSKGRRMTIIFSALVDLYEQLISLNIQDDKLIESLKNSHLQADFTQGLLDMKEILEHISWAINIHKKIHRNIEISLLDKFKKRILDLEKYEQESGIEQTEVIHLLKHIRFIFRSFYKQTLIIKSIINGENANDNNTYQDLDIVKFTREYTYNFSTFKANLNLKSNIFRHALRVSTAILIAYIFCIILNISFFSLLFLTIILILKPVYGNTRTYALRRLQGTLIGASITLVIFLFTRDPYILSIITVLSVLGAYSFLSINYKIGISFVTIFVLLLVYLEHRGGGSLSNLLIRLGGTSIAVVIAFIFSFLFLPTWENKQLPKLIGNLIRNNLDYFSKISFNLVESNNQEMISDTEIKLARKEVLLATSNFSSTFQRIVSEPALSKEYKSTIYSLQTQINLLSTRISSLRTYNFTSNKDIVTDLDKKIIALIKELLNGAIVMIQKDQEEIDSEADWKEIDFNLSQKKLSLTTYQLKEIYNLVQQIYTNIKKIKDFKEWKSAEK
ncbi:hypothetical protein ETU10_05320 [Apibacter muscae]|uniref:FUSC family protein n=1 Tax=Apibacter muscae TaxID=2509004 RepID=UPI0011ACA2BB|nr:FUSC family membrane protein [Apibacter muscae]TWP24106.1 hypothetical protein ETU10_05320 [Apibacter muscae]